MYLAAILAAVLLAPLSPARTPCRDAACRVSGSDSAQAPASSPENSQNPASEQVQPNAAGQKQSESNAEQPPPAKEVETPSAQKPPSSQPATSVRKRRSHAHKPITPPTADGEPRKIVVHQGGAGEPVTQILPGITLEEASHQRESAEQLLASAESHLTQLAARTLNPKQQQTVVQIRQYMDGARSALKDSDTQRSHTLAMKAYLLSDDLVKH
jgi:hypothetical protein